MSLDEVLSLGTDLVEQWELLHGCHVTDAHLDARMLQTMTDAVVQVLTLYEVAAEFILGGWDKTEEPHGGAGDRSSNPLRTSSRSSDSSMEIEPALSVTKPTAHLGSMQLDDSEMTVVSREALRHATMRLGEMLHDIEDDISITGAHSSQSSDHAVEVKQIMSRLLRLLGRINSNDSSLNEKQKHY